MRYKKIWDCNKKKEEKKSREWGWHKREVKCFDNKIEPWMPDDGKIIMCQIREKILTFIQWKWKIKSCDFIYWCVILNLIKFPPLGYFSLSSQISNTLSILLTVGKKIFCTHQYEFSYESSNFLSAQRLFHKLEMGMERASRLCMHKTFFSFTFHITKNKFHK